MCAGWCIRHELTLIGSLVIDVGGTEFFSGATMLLALGRTVSVPMLFIDIFRILFCYIFLLIILTCLARCLVSIKSTDRLTGLSVSLAFPLCKNPLAIVSHPSPLALPLNFCEFSVGALDSYELSLCKDQNAIINLVLCAPSVCSIRIDRWSLGDGTGWASSPSPCYSPGPTPLSRSPLPLPRVVSLRFM